MSDTKDPVCEICKGRGFVPIATSDPRYQAMLKEWGPHIDAYITEDRCECNMRKRFRKWVGDPIYNAEVIESSVLFGRESENLFINASRPDTLANLKYILSRKDFSWPWKMTTDSDLRDIFVGNHEDFPSVSSYVRSPELVVIQLAVLSYKNVAMPGVVLEALRSRQFDGKATWLINPYSNPFREGHLSWSMELEYYIKENFKSVDIANTQKTTTISPNESQTDIKNFRKINQNIDFM